MAKKSWLWCVLTVVCGLLLTGCIENIIPSSTRYSLTISIEPQGAGTITPASGTK